MKKEIISQFRETPRTKLGWWSFGLSIGAIMSGPILGTFAAAIRPLIDKALNENLGATIGFVFGGVIVVIIIVDFILSIMAFGKGERSWAVWVALVFSTIAVCMLTALVIGEFAFPH